MFYITSLQVPNMTMATVDVSEVYRHICDLAKYPQSCGSR